jgi:hypothetical protein
MRSFRRWFFRDVEKSFVQVFGQLLYIEKGLQDMSAAFDLMEAKVAELKTVDDSVLALITKLVEAVQGAATLAEAQQIVAEIDAEKEKLAAAVQANT